MCVLCVSCVSCVRACVRVHAGSVLRVLCVLCVSCHCACVCMSALCCVVCDACACACARVVFFRLGGQWSKKAYPVTVFTNAPWELAQAHLPPRPSRRARARARAVAWRGVACKTKCACVALPWLVGVGCRGGG